MPSWVWVPIALAAAAFVWTAVFALTTFRRLGRMRATAAALQASVEDLAERADALQQRLDRTAERGDEVDRALGRLRASLDRLAVLGWALGDARDAVVRFRVFTRK